MKSIRFGTTITFIIFLGMLLALPLRVKADINQYATATQNSDGTVTYLLNHLDAIPTDDTLNYCESSVDSSDLYLEVGTHGVRSQGSCTISGSVVSTYGQGSGWVGNAINFGLSVDDLPTSKVAFDVSIPSDSEFPDSIPTVEVQLDDGTSVSSTLPSLGGHFAYTAPKGNGIIQVVVSTENGIPPLSVSNIAFTVFAPNTLDLSIAGISVTQPTGTTVPTDANGYPILSSVMPANQLSQASVLVNLTGTPSGMTTTTVQLSLGGTVVATQNIDISSFQQGNNLVNIPFTPTGSGVQQLAAAINNGRTVQESNYSNDSLAIGIDVMVLCKVEDYKNKTVNFRYQTQTPWNTELYGIPSLSTIAGSTMGLFGCSVTDLAMLFNYYGVTSTPIGAPAYAKQVNILNYPAGLQGKPLDPGSLNYAMANYRTSLTTKASVGFNVANDPDWAGAAQVARAGYAAQCASSSCTTPVSSIVSYGGLTVLPESSSDVDLMAATQSQICSGNPVIVKFGEPLKVNSKTNLAFEPQHFMLVTGFVYDQDNKKRTFRVHNPGTSTGANQLYSNIVDDYPIIKEIELYKSAADPSMMRITAPINVHFVVTDPQGRRTGYDPTTGTNFTEIPGAGYTEQTIDTPNETGFTPERLVDERYFTSVTNVLDGTYQIQIFGITSGSYYLDSASYDSSGTLNDSVYKTGTVQAGGKATIALQHSSNAVVVTNAALTVKHYGIWHAQKQSYANSEAFIEAQLTPYGAPITFNSQLQLSIGSVNGYNVSIPTNKFKQIKLLGQTLFYYLDKNVDVIVNKSGFVSAYLHGIDLSNIDQSQFDYLSVSLDTTSGSTSAQLQCKGSLCQLHEHECDGTHGSHH